MLEEEGVLRCLYALVPSAAERREPDAVHVGCAGSLTPRGRSWAPLADGPGRGRASGPGVPAPVSSNTVLGCGCGAGLREESREYFLPPSHVPHRPHPNLPEAARSLVREALQVVATSDRCVWRCQRSRVGASCGSSMASLTPAGRGHRLTFCDSGDGRKGRPEGRFHSGLERGRVRLSLSPQRGHGPMCGHTLTGFHTNVPWYTRSHEPTTPGNLARGDALEALLGTRLCECAQGRPLPHWRRLEQPGWGAPRRSGRSGSPCPSSCSREASRVPGQRLLGVGHKEGF